MRPARCSAPSIVLPRCGRRQALRPGDRARRRASSAFRSCSIDRSESWKHIWRRGEGRARGGAVVIHLAYQRLNGVEFQLVANETDEGDVEDVAVEVALEIEQEHFEQRRAIVEGRATAVAGDTIDARGPAADPHRIDAVLERAVLVEADIGGGIAEIAAAPFAMDHLAGDEPWPAQHGGGVSDLAFRERHADGAR